MRALNDSPWKTRIAAPKQTGFSRWHGDEAARRAVTNNRARLKSGVAREAFKLRAEIVERCFAHNLDRGGMRRTWLRGRENVHKRYLLHVAGHNLSLLMRQLRRRHPAGGRHTEYPGVVLPGHLRERYPEEMTVVLQHQFWGLETNDQGFEVTLSFDDVHEYMFVPFAAMTAFADPSVQFGLQFKSGEDSQAAADAQESSAPSAPREDTQPGEIVALDSFRKK